MKSRGAFLAGVCALIMSSASFAHAKPVGSLSCAGNAGSVKFNVSYFTFGLQQTTNIGSQSAGAGAGKVTFQPMEVHAALSTFASLVDVASTGQVFQTCMLTAKLDDGTQAEFDFKLVAISSLTAAASSSAQQNEPARYTDVQFLYGAVEVKSSGSGDDGGTGGTPTPPGWNQIQNQ